MLPPHISDSKSLYAFNSFGTVKYEALPAPTLNEPPLTNCAIDARNFTQIQ